ncbi:MAG: Dps family protein [Alphaproteobacteria bacterium]|jgi:starvation-inducible DNA-binding protein
MPNNKELISVINNAVATAYATALIVKTHHWNVKGQNFFVLHKFYDEIYASLIEQADDNAERLRALGEVVKDTPSLVADTLKNTKTGDFSDTASAKFIKQQYSAYKKLIATLLEKSLKLEDNVTADKATGQLEAIEKNLWMLDAFLG